MFFYNANHLAQNSQLKVIVSFDYKVYFKIFQVFITTLSVVGLVLADISVSNHKDHHNNIHS